MLQSFIKIVLEAGKILKSFFRKRFEINHKGVIDLVTTADLEVESFIRKALSKDYSDFPVIGEEYSNLEKSGCRGIYFLLDPLDGTTNFAHGLPWFAISLALMKDFEPQIGIIYNPITEELFYAERGKGAYLGDKPINVSQRENLIDSLLATGFPVSSIREKPKHFIAPFEEFMVRTRGVRRFGAASLDLAYVAAGFYDGFYEAFLKPWDTAAGFLLVEAAGGKVTDYLGNPFHPFRDTIVASNGLIHEEMLEILRKMHPNTFKPFRNPIPAVDLIIEYGDGIVLIERKNPPLGLALPGGFVEYGETLEEAAKREAQEETNLEVKLIEIVGCYSDPNRDPRFHTIATVFLARGSGELKGKDDAKKAMVFKVNEIPWKDLVFDHEKILKDYLKKRGIAINGNK
ncbi:MAG: NUDIX domain-containing protein [Caldimicrobium sp.]|nr:NUDIX domain-containing protein [Caldimicrobium sp.]MCX7874176.1 NUDIX domain-containing protein [Caldimicrobium sp.]MDW8094319.1 inositol monophosphatase family protein [Caldimicrobium sp.]